MDEGLFEADLELDAVDGAGLAVTEVEADHGGLGALLTVGGLPVQTDPVLEDHVASGGDPGFFILGLGGGDAAEAESDARGCRQRPFQGFGHHC